MSGGQDSENVHGIRYINHGSVGSVVLLEKDNNFFHLQRAISSMLSTLGTMVGSLNYLNEELYRRLHQDYDTSSGASLDKLRRDMNEFRRYARVIIYESLPDSICTDSFDASMYTKAWDTWEGYVIVENVEKHIQSISELIEYVQSRLYEQADKRTAFFCQRYPAAFLTRAAFARHHNHPNPDILAAELADLESAG